MAEKEQKPPKVPLGEGMTAEELDQLSHFTQGDVETAKARFRRDAARGFRDLLDATRSDED